MEWLNKIKDPLNNYLSALRKNENFTFFPAKKNLTKYGETIELGFSTYALKIYYMTGEWEKLSINDQKKWIGFLNSFQKNVSRFPNNSYVDEYLVKSYDDSRLTKLPSEIAKKILNFSKKYNFESQNLKLLKAINAESKQAISTLNQVGSEDYKLLENILDNHSEVSSYLNRYDWSKPWNAGAQFSSLCVYSNTHKLNLELPLQSYINKKLDPDTGSYFSHRPESVREIINGAMKVLTGLDWINVDIHKPDKLIDFCLSNEPVSEGCDIVDYVYVLSKCSQQTNHRKNEINKVFLRLLDDIKSLYVPEEGGFSYFVKKSQTHYYGAEIIKQTNQADLHGTLLSLWGISMICNNLEDNKINLDLKILKP